MNLLNFPILSFIIMKLVYLYDLFYKYIYDEKDKITNIKIDPIEDYLNKYKIKLENLEIKEHDNQSLNKLRNNILYETTPYGNILMFYDNEYKKFNYYSNKILPYNYLETACRRYVINFNCKMLYVDINKEFNNVKNKKKNEEINNTENIKNDKKCSDNKLYLQPKSYNKPKKPKSRATIDENKSKIIDFKYCGRIIDFNFLKKDVTSIKNIKIKNISFSEFKKRSNI